MNNNKNRISGVVDVLLYGVEDVGCPMWKKLPRQVKHMLMKKLGEEKYNNIHDPRFYRDLENISTKRQEMKVREVQDRVRHECTVECPICLDTYEGDGKVTTLMCGHKFCTKCSLQHIQQNGSRASCPMCRRSVFNIDTAIVKEEEPVGVAERLLEWRREKRRLERRNKRQRNKQNKN